MKKLVPLLGIMLVTAFLLGCIGEQQENTGQVAQNNTGITPVEQSPENFSTEQEAVESLEQVLNELEEQELANTTGELA